MIRFRTILATFIICLACLNVAWGQYPWEKVNPELQKKRWPAQWITHPSASSLDYGVFHFRKDIELDSVPASFKIHVTADNRYKLIVNGVLVGRGPSRGDLYHWRFETYDIAANLKPGRNVLAAVVWNFGLDAPVAQITIQTALLVQGDTPIEHLVNTSQDWLVMQNMAYQPEMESAPALQSYYVVGPSEIVDGNKYPKGWDSGTLRKEDWLNARELSQGLPRGLTTDGKWMLVPRAIPFMEEKESRFAALRRAENITVGDEFLTGTGPIEIPPNSSVSLLLDQGNLTNSYPELHLSGGSGVQVKISYAETLFKSRQEKGNRNEVDNKQFIGISDYYYPNGEASQLYAPLWFRTYRYVQLEIQTKQEPLTLNDFLGNFTGYPFQENAQFKTNRESLTDIWNTGWRTARLCAGETYFDCPYYEQIQYVGDTRIQALISLYVSGDDRLMRRAITDFDESRAADGLTQSRYPVSKRQFIPPYSLFWIAMVHDYWMHRDDRNFVKSFLPGVRDQISWHENYLQEDMMLGKVPWWNYVDWTDEWVWDPEVGFGGIPAGALDGNSSILTLQFVYALNYAAQLHRAFEMDNTADQYEQMAKKIKKATYDLCWDPGKRMLADTPEKNIFSQHANILAILTDLIPPKEQPALFKRIARNESLIQTTFYYKFYLFEAMRKTGLEVNYLDLLQPWREMIDLGLTTFAERPDPTRSDCHAWSASPNYHLLSILAGITPAEPGFKSVRIKPILEEISQIQAQMPHPMGEIRVSFEKKEKGGSSASIHLPVGVTGTLIWGKREMLLREGQQTIKFP